MVVGEGRHQEIGGWIERGSAKSLLGVWGCCLLKASTDMDQVTHDRRAVALCRARSRGMRARKGTERGDALSCERLGERVVGRWETGILENDWTRTEIPWPRLLSG